jgi:hypothetical protein
MNPDNEEFIVEALGIDSKDLSDFGPAEQMISERLPGIVFILTTHGRSYNWMCWSNNGFRDLISPNALSYFPEGKTFYDPWEMTFEIADLVDQIFPALYTGPIDEIFVKRLKMFTPWQQFKKDQAWRRTSKRG